MSRVKILVLRLMFLSLILLSTTTFAEKAVVVMNKSGCQDYFVAYGLRGYYIMQWYGGPIPFQGDVIVGDINSFGMKSIYYINKGVEGKVYVDDYLLSVDDAARKYSEKCGIY